MQELNIKPILSDKEYRLLSKFFDGECGYFEYRRAKRLLEQHQGAAECLALFERLAVGVKSSKNEAAGRLDNMWDRVSARIEAEERSQILLGKRSLDNNASFAWQKIFSKASLQELQNLFGARAFGVSAMVLAATLILVVVGPYSNFSNNNNNNVAANVSAPGSKVSGFGLLPVSGRINEKSEEPFTRPQIVEDQYQRALEVDWVRSPGRVKFIQNPRERSAIIWVRRREPRVGTFAAAAPEVKPTVLFESNNQRSAE